MQPNQENGSIRPYFASQSRLVRVDQQVYEELHVIAGKIQVREGRRASVNDALRALLFPKNARSFAPEQTAVFKSRAIAAHPRNSRRIARALEESEPLKLFSLKNRAFVADTSKKLRKTKLENKA